MRVCKTIISAVGQETLVKELRIARPCPSLVNKQGDRDRLGENSSSSDMRAGA